MLYLIFFLLNKKDEGGFLVDPLVANVALSARKLLLFVRRWYAPERIFFYYFRFMLWIMKLKFIILKISVFSSFFFLVSFYFCCSLLLMKFNWNSLCSSTFFFRIFFVQYLFGWLILNAILMVIMIIIIIINVWIKRLKQINEADFFYFGVWLGSFRVVLRFEMNLGFKA